MNMGQQTLWPQVKDEVATDGKPGSSNVISNEKFTF